MKCERCGRGTATVRYAEVVDGSLTTWHLCEECASERGVTGSLTSLAGPLVNILMGLLEGGGGAEPVDSGPTCPRCGLTYEAFRRAGRLGCGTCYETFASQLKPLLRRIHGSTDHTGGVPSTDEGGHFRRREISKLKRELTRAVAAEDYERAAELRDTVRARERELGSTETGDVDV
ncbi:UvrB/UvrC motif-containing protein [bacterium]|jgi:protein arginine kinase activator|nr:UvrB/UvrC motif-containing protein [bacterium]